MGVDVHSDKHNWAVLCTCHSLPGHLLGVKEFETSMLCECQVDAHQTTSNGWTFLHSDLRNFSALYALADGVSALCFGRWCQAFCKKEVTQCSIQKAD